MTSGTTWLVVADAARARIFRVEDRGSKLVPASNHQLVHASLADKELVSDKPGRTFDRFGQGRHAKEPPSDPAEVEARRFAKEVVETLDAERKKDALGHVILVAPPGFLGDLRAEMREPLSRIVAAQVNKDLSKLTPAELIEHLGDTLST